MRVDRTAAVALHFVLQGRHRYRQTIPILMYHSISRQSEARVRPYYKVTTSPERFRAHMQWLSDHGYSTLDLRQALDLVRSPSGPIQRAVVITFDDGFRDFLQYAWPVLADHGFTAT